MAQPPQRPIHAPEDAELLAMEWLRYAGYRDAKLTKRGADAGIDVRSAKALTQVKAHQRPIGRPALQNLTGIASHEGRQALFFSLSGYTNEAKAWAESTSMALFVFNQAGVVSPVNRIAEGIVREARGLPPLVTLNSGVLTGSWFLAGTAGTVAYAFLGDSVGMSFLTLMLTGMMFVGSWVGGLVVALHRSRNGGIAISVAGLVFAGLVFAENYRPPSCWQNTQEVARYARSAGIEVPEEGFDTIFSRLDQLSGPFIGPNERKVNLEQWDFWVATAPGDAKEACRGYRESGGN